MEQLREPPETRTGNFVTDIAAPEHLQRFPCMRPWVGSRYRDRLHKRLLVMGESHYLPDQSTIHHDPARWYGSSQDDLSEEEVRWACTVGNITGRWYRGHTIYREIRNTIARTFQEGGVTPDEFPLNHIAYCNYFLRPAPRPGGSMEGNEAPRDVAVAEQVVRWFILRHRPQLVIVTSRFASRYAEEIVCGCGIPCLSTPHPGSRWWNTKARSYGNITGRERFFRFLKEQHWLVSRAAADRA